jgi:streptogramin lyase
VIPRSICAGILSVTLFAGCGAGPVSSPSASVAVVTPTDSGAPPPALATLALQATVSGLYGPVDVLATADSVWVVEHEAATLTRIDPATNQVTASVKIGSGSANGLGLAAKRLWTFDQTGGQVVAVDPATAKVVSTVKLGQDGDFFAVGDGATWLVTGGELARVDGSTGKVTSYPAPAACKVDGFAVGGGFVWLATTDGALCKIDEKSGAVLAQGSKLGNGSGITTVAGQPWMAGADGGLSIIDPEALTVRKAIPAPAPGSQLGAAFTLGLPGGDRTVVVGDPDGNGGWLRNFGTTIGRITLGAPPEDGIRLYGLFPTSSVAGSVVSAFGSVWVANFDAGTVERYAPPTP